MTKIKYAPMGYSADCYFSAYICKGNQSRLVLVGLPYYSWKESFEALVEERGMKVYWR